MRKGSLRARGGGNHHLGDQERLSPYAPQEAGLQEGAEMGAAAYTLSPPCTPVTACTLLAEALCLSDPWLLQALHRPQLPSQARQGPFRQGAAGAQEGKAAWTPHASAHLTQFCPRYPGATSTCSRACPDQDLTLAAQPTPTLRLGTPARPGPVPTSGYRISGPGALLLVNHRHVSLPHSYESQVSPPSRGLPGLKPKLGAHRSVPMHYPP